MGPLGQDFTLRLPPRVTSGQPVSAEHHNMLIGALEICAREIQKRTPRNGQSVGHRSGPGGFTSHIKQTRGPARRDLAPFQVVSIWDDEGTWKVRIAPGRVISRNPVSGEAAVKPWMPTYSGTALNAATPPAITMALGDYLYCRVSQDDTGAVDATPTIEVSSTDHDGTHYAPQDPDESSGTDGDEYYKLIQLTDDGDGKPLVVLHRTSDIELCPYLWTGQNLGGGEELFKDHDETQGPFYRWRTITATSPLTATTIGNTIDIAMGDGEDLNLRVTKKYYSLGSLDEMIFNYEDDPVIYYWRDGIYIGLTDPDDGLGTTVDVDFWEQGS